MSDISEHNGDPDKSPHAQTAALGTNTVISIIIPAHNEETVIARCLTALTEGHSPGELQIIVSCNGCTDDTAKIAREFGPPVQVVETDEPSKTNAINLAEEVAKHYPRLYIDADVVMSLASVRELIKALDTPGILAVAPAVRTLHSPKTSWLVRYYYEFWMNLPYIQEGMMAAGVYGLNLEGRSRFEHFPKLISDDGYVRLHFNQYERIEVKSAVSNVAAPSTIRDLIKIKTRSRLGVRELMSMYPEKYADESKSKNYSDAIIRFVKTPKLYIHAIPYVFVTLLSRYRARKQFRTSSQYLWERDESSRNSSPSNTATNVGR